MTLPPNVVSKGGLLYYRRKIAGRDNYRRLPALDDPRFSVALLEAREEMSRRDPGRKFLSALSSTNVKRWNARARKRILIEPMPAWVVLLGREARKRAKRRGWQFDLSPDDLAALVKRAGGRCEVSGLAFDHARLSRGRWRPFAPSLDRIDCATGYTYSNLRLVCVSVNAALNQWGDAVFWEMVNSAAQRFKGETTHVAGGK